MRPKDCKTVFRHATRVLWLFLLLFAAAPVYAAGDQQTIASNFLRFLGRDKGIVSEEVLERNSVDPASPPVAVAHLFSLEGGGYILVSTDRSISPVKAYSLTGDFTDLPEPYRKALLDELELRVRVAGFPVAGRVLQSEEVSETAARWDFLLRYDARRQPLAEAAVVEPLITAHWDQGYPYNKHLPKIGGENTVAGCVNVALGQIMRHHKHPASGKGVFAYDWNDESVNPAVLERLKAIFYHGYNWDIMPGTLDQATPEYQIDEVALLLRDLGIANSTRFGLTDSSASFLPDNLLKHFGYSTALAKIDNTAYTAFIDVLKTDLGAGRPLLLAFSEMVRLEDNARFGGHMVVADGYAEDDAGLKAHLNMGWGGRIDDFYFLDQPVPAVSSEYAFDTSAGKLTLHYNIKPCTTGSDCYVNLEAGDTAADLAMNGNFDREKDEDIYEFYLKGDTSFSASRGYSNVAFYVSIISMLDGRTVFSLADPDAEDSANQPIESGTLTAGKYRVRVSLCNDVRCYSPTDGFNAYNVELTTQSMTAEEVSVVDQALAGPPVIGNSALPDLILNSASVATKRILIDARVENGDALALSVDNSNPSAVSAVFKGNILELTPTGAPKIASRIVVTAAANGQSAQRSFVVMTDNSDTSYGRSFILNGVFADQDDVYLHPAILDGDCAIQGNTTGYVGQGFFSSVLANSGDAVITPETSAAINQSYSRAVYRLKAALKDSGGAFYPYYVNDPDHADTNKFTLSVSCPNADVAPQTIAGLLGIDLSGADLTIIRDGDINGDEMVNMADAVLGLQLLTRATLPVDQKINLAADPDHSGKIDSADVVFILQKTAGLR